MPGCEATDPEAHKGRPALNPISAGAPSLPFFKTRLLRIAKGLSTYWRIISATGRRGLPDVNHDINTKSFQLPGGKGLRFIPTTRRCPVRLAKSLPLSSVPRWRSTHASWPCFRPLGKAGKLLILNLGRASSDNWNQKETRF